MTGPNGLPAFARTVSTYFRGGIDASAVPASLRGLLHALGPGWVQLEAKEEADRGLLQVLLVHRPTAAYYTFTLVADHGRANYTLAPISVRRIF